MAANPFTDLETKLDTLTEMVARLERQLNNTAKPASGKPLNIQQAADYIDVAKGTMYGFTSRREIPHFKRGKRVYFYTSDLDTWLKANRQKTVEEIEQEA